MKDIIRPLSNINMQIPMRAFAFVSHFHSAFYLVFNKRMNAEFTYESTNCVWARIFLKHSPGSPYSALIILSRIGGIPAAGFYLVLFPGASGYLFLVLVILGVVSRIAQRQWRPGSKFRYKI